MLTAFPTPVQARVEEAGQALLRRTQDAGGIGPRRKGKRSRFHMDAYEEHMLLPEVCDALHAYLKCHAQLRMLLESVLVPWQQRPALAA